MSKPRIRDFLSKSELVPVLEDYEVSVGSSICALYPEKKYVLPKLRVFLDFLGDWFREPRTGNKGTAFEKKAPVLKAGVGG